MSKASEWAKRRVDAEREWDASKDSPSWSCKHGGISASVRSDGDLTIHVSDGNRARVFPDQALAFARWIINTFADAPEAFMPALNDTPTPPDGGA